MCYIALLYFSLPISILSYTYRHIVVWKKAEGVWLAHVDILNSDVSVKPEMDDDSEITDHD